MTKSTHQYYRPIALLAFSIFILFSCSKDEVIPPDYEKLLVSSEWTFVEEVSLDATNAALINTLLTGTTLTFNADGNLNSYFFAFDLVNTWELNTDKTSILIDKGLASEDEWIIVSITETELIFRDYDDDDPSGGALPFSLTDGKPYELKFTH